MAHTWFVDGSSDASTLVERCEKTFKGKGPHFTTTTNPGSLSSVDLLSNGIGIDQAKALASILKGHPTLKSLCGHKGDETMLDVSGKNILPAVAIMLTPEIAGNGAMTKLTFGDKQVFTMTTEMTEANFSGKLKCTKYDLGTLAQIVAAFLPKCT